MVSDPAINGLAGAAGGIVAQILTYPLQTVNTRQQTEHDPAMPSSSSTSSRSSCNAIRQMYLVVKHEGWDRLYGGLMPSLLGTASSQGIYYYFYQIFRNKAEAVALERWKKGRGDGSVGMLGSLAVAALAGCTNVLLTNPIWVVVTRMQTHKKRHTSDEEPLSHSPYRSGDVVQELYAEAGFLGFWKGVVPTLIMVSNPAIQFMLYETLLKKARRRKNQDIVSGRLTAIEIFLLIAVAKLGATLVTYPLLVVKARLHMKQGSDDHSIDKRFRYKGTADAFGKIMRYEGAAGFYKGMGTKVVQSVVAAAVLFTIKEELVKAARLLLAPRGDGLAKNPRR